MDLLGRIFRIYLMAVGGLATLLVASTPFFLHKPHQDASRELAEMQLDMLCRALQLYRLDNGTYPTTEQGLDALVKGPAIEPRPVPYPSGGYAREQNLIDPWGEPLSYSLEDGVPWLRSVCRGEGKAVERRC